MNDNVALNGSVRLKHGSPWRGQMDLEDLLLFRNSANSTSCGVHMVSYTIESIIPLHAVKLYTLTSQRYHAYTNSTVLHEYFCEVYNATSIFNQPKYALLISIRNSGTNPGNPFDDHEAAYPLAKESYMLLFGQRLVENKQGKSKQDTPGSLQVFGQVLRNKFDYTNFYTLSNMCESTLIHSPLTLDINRKDNTINHSSDNTKHIDMAALIIESYRPGLLLNESDQHKQQSWESIFDQDMNRLRKMDKLRDETKRSRPERTLSFTKRKPFQQRKNGNITSQPSSTIPITRSSSAASILLPPASNPSAPVLTTSGPLSESASASQPLTSVHIKRQQSLPNNSTKNMLLPSVSSSQSITTNPSQHDANRKQLKSAIWSKLIHDGHNKKSDDTIAFYHIIYQSMQYVLRKTFKTAPLDPQQMESLINSHVQFYRGQDLDNDLSL